MLFSIFTPTHNTQYLVEIYDSLMRQECEDWEWAIVPICHSGPIPGNIQGDERVLVVPAPGAE